MIRWIRSLFAWHAVRVGGVWLYEENTITRQRRAYRLFEGGHSPIDWEWLDEGRGHPRVNGYAAWMSAEGQRSGHYCY